MKRKDSVFLLLLSGYMFVHTSRLHKHIHVNVHSLKVNQRYTPIQTRGRALVKSSPIRIFPSEKEFLF